MGLFPVAASSVKRQASLRAAANGSSRIALKCPRSVGINALNCANDLYDLPAARSHGGDRSACAALRPETGRHSAIGGSDRPDREILSLAGWIALLIACIEYDSGDRQAAETHLSGRAVARDRGRTDTPAARIVRGWAEPVKAVSDRQPLTLNTATVLIHS